MILNEEQLGEVPRRWLALVHLPVSLGVKSYLQQSIFWIVPFAAAWADEITAPRSALMVVVFGDGESCSATARDQEHAQREFVFIFIFGILFGLLRVCALAFHDSSTVAYEVLFRLFDCKVFLRAAAIWE